MTLNYYLRDALRFSIIVLIAVIWQRGTSAVFFGPNGILPWGDHIPVIMAVVLAMFLDHKIPETKA